MHRLAASQPLEPPWIRGRTRAPCPGGQSYPLPPGKSRVEAMLHALPLQQGLQAFFSFVWEVA